MKAIYNRADVEYHLLSDVNTIETKARYNLGRSKPIRSCDVKSIEMKARYN